MIVASAWEGRRYAVLGLARSGVATVRALRAGGAKVVAWDERGEARTPFLPIEDEEGDREAVEGHHRVAHSVQSGTPASPSTTRVPRAVPLPSGAGEDVTLADPLTLNLADLEAVVVSPGISLNAHPIAAQAWAAGVPIIGDVELFAQVRTQLPPHRVVGITGTNGKSTVTALVHHMCATAGVPSLALGNIGEPILAAEPLPAGGVYVVELSSYQIDLTRSLDCDVAVLLNITPDHLDRYADFAAYAASKERLFTMQSPGHVAVIALADEPSAAIAGRAPAKVRRVAPGVCLDQGRWPALQGPHNAVNALAAIEVARALGLEEAAIDAALESFTGLPHRLERVGERGGVAFVNDSKATNPEAAAPALGAFDRIHWILGGRAKGPELGPCLDRLDHVAHAYTIGEAGPVFADALKGRVPVSRCGTLDQAVAEAAGQARAGDTVLLSPACASFDQYPDFAARGDEFRRLVEALPC